MSDDRKAALEERIEENQRKIEEISAFRDDPKIDKIIRVHTETDCSRFLSVEFIGQGSLTLKCSSAFSARIPTLHSGSVVAVACRRAAREPSRLYKSKQNLAFDQKPQWHMLLSCSFLSPSRSIELFHRERHSHVQ